jgi:hypothetical protein
MNKELLLLLFVEAELVRNKKQQKHVYYLHVTGYNHLICGKLPLTLIKSRIFNSTYSWFCCFLVSFHALFFLHSSVLYEKESK